MSLVGVVYFLRHFEKGKAEHTQGRLAHTNPTDPEDRINQWLTENTLPRSVQDPYELHGQNGVTCHIKTRLAETREPEELEQSSLFEQGPYARVVQVGYQPNNRSLPRELLGELMALGYEKTAVNLLGLGKL